MKKGFTLAETLIVLVVIGVLAAILLPVARNIAPDRNLMKFKKAHNTLLSAVRELVQSEEYYLNGDLGIKVDGTQIDGWYESPEIIAYFCQTLGQVLNVKSVNCHFDDTAYCGAIDVRLGTEFSWTNSKEDKLPVTNDSLTNSKKILDKHCKEIIDKNMLVVGDNGREYRNSDVQITLADGTVFYEENPASTFGWQGYVTTPRRFSPPSQNIANYPDENGFDAIYKVVCIDIDGIPSNATETDCVNECPFGYGIRADGKMLTGKRADEWLEKEK